MSYEEAVRELYFWQYSNTGCFHNMLFDLMQKADIKNYVKLCTAFPHECHAFTEWMASSDNGNDLFREHGLLK